MEIMHEEVTRPACDLEKTVPTPWKIASARADEDSASLIYLFMMAICLENT